MSAAQVGVRQGGKGGGGVCGFLLPGGGVVGGVVCGGMFVIRFGCGRYAVFHTLSPGSREKCIRIFRGVPFPSPASQGRRIQTGNTFQGRITQFGEQLCVRGEDVACCRAEAGGGLVL